MLRTPRCALCPSAERVAFAFFLLLAGCGTSDDPPHPSCEEVDASCSPDAGEDVSEPDAEPDALPCEAPPCLPPDPELPAWALELPEGPPLTLSEQCDAVSSEVGGGTWRHQFSVASEAGLPGLLLHVQAAGAELVGVSLRDADGLSLDLDTYHRYVALQQELSPRALSLLLPAVPAAPDLLGAGVVEVVVDSSSASSPCLTLIAQTAEEEERVLGLDIFLVGDLGQEGLEAATAVQDERLRQMLEAVERALEAAEVRLDRVRFHELPEVEGWSPLLGPTHLEALTQAIPRPIGDARRVLSVPVFLVNGFGGAYPSGTAGMTAGIPAALPAGQRSAGLVVSARQLGSELGNEMVGITLAHELGHALGLMHTTELEGVRGDPFEDTPQCSSGLTTNAAACPDYRNLMFPYALRRWPLELSPMQVGTLRAHPSLREEER